MLKPLLIVFYLLFTTQANAAQTYGHFTVGKLISVYDGDTIRVDLVDCDQPLMCSNIPIRVFGIDTPEIRGKCDFEKTLAKKARDVMREILNNASTIELRNTSRGKYFRIVARVFADDVEAGQILIEQELAARYFGKGKKQSWCNENLPK